MYIIRSSAYNVNQNMQRISSFLCRDKHDDDDYCGDNADLSHLAVPNITYKVHKSSSIVYIVASDSGCVKS